MRAAAWRGPLSRTIRRATFVTALALVLTIPASGREAETVAPSTSPAPSADAAAPEPVLTDDAFPYPHLPPPTEVPLPAALQPEGRPDASTTRHGVRVELWLSSPIAEPGEWMQAVVRTTNLRRTPAWSTPGECGGSTTGVGIDARLDIPTGVEQEGNAAEFKRRAVRKGQVRGAGFDERKDVLRWVTGSVSNGGNLGIRGVPGPPRASPPGAPRQRHRALRLVPREQLRRGRWRLVPAPLARDRDGHRLLAVPRTRCQAAAAVWSELSAQHEAEFEATMDIESPATVPARPRSRSSWTQRSPSRPSGHGWMGTPPGSRGPASRGAAHQARRIHTTSTPSAWRTHRPPAWSGSRSTGSGSSPTGITSCVASPPSILDR